MLKPQNDFQCPEVRDLCRGTGKHKSCCTSDAHPFPEPFLQKRDRPSAAGVKRHPDGRSHQDAPCFIAAEEFDHMFLRHIALKHGREQNAKEKVRPRHPDIAPNVQQIADQDIGMGVVAFLFLKPGKVEEAPVPVAKMDQQSCRTSAEEAGNDPHREYCGPQSGTVDDELRVEEDRSHHKCCKPVMPQALPGKRRGNGNGAVHAKR